MSECFLLTVGSCFLFIYLFKVLDGVILFFFLFFFDFSKPMKYRDLAGDHHIQEFVCHNIFTLAFAPKENIRRASVREWNKWNYITRGTIHSYVDDSRVWLINTHGGLNILIQYLLKIFGIWGKRNKTCFEKLLPNTIESG